MAVSEQIESNGVLADGFHPTDLGNARRLVSLWGTKLRYADRWKMWYCWDGRRWVQDPDKVQVGQRAVDVPGYLFKLVGKVGNSEDRDRLYRHALASESSRALESTIRLARLARGVQLDYEQFDLNPWLLNCGNGVLDLRTGELLPHDPGYLCSRITPVEYDPTAEAPHLEEFLDQVLPDPLVRRYVQRFCGYCLTGSVSEQIFPIWWGEGANGKSTLIELMRYAMGEYAVQVAPEMLMASSGDHHPTMYADLFRARLAFREETKELGRLDESRVKSLTGGGRVKARRMREDFWEFDPTHQLVLVTNHQPTIEGTDHAIWRRVHLVPFVARVEEADQVKDLADIVAYLELPGVLRWAVEGCRQWQEVGLDPPQGVLAATRDYQEGSDVVGRFLRDCLRPSLVEDREPYVPARVLMDVYVNWCREEQLRQPYPDWQRAVVPRLRSELATERTTARVGTDHVVSKVWMHVILTEYGETFRGARWQPGQI